MTIAQDAYLDKMKRKHSFRNAYLLKTDTVLVVECIIRNRPIYTMVHPSGLLIASLIISKSFKELPADVITPYLADNAIKLPK